MSAGAVGQKASVGSGPKAAVEERIEEVRSEIEDRANLAQDKVADALSGVEEHVNQNPLGAIAVAAGVGFLLSQLRADRAARQLGAVPFLIGAVTAYIASRPKLGLSLHERKGKATERR